MKKIEIAAQHDAAAINALFLRTRKDAEYVFGSSIRLREEGCAQRPLILSNSDYTGTKNVALCLEGMKNVTLDFRGYTLECSGHMQPLTLLDCSDITIKNLRIDWAIPMAAEGEVVGAGEDHIDLAIDSSAFPFTVEDGELYFYLDEKREKKSGVYGGMHTAFSKNTKTVVPGSGDKINVSGAERLSEDSLRIFGKYNQIYENGTIIVLRHGWAMRRHAGIFAEGCKNLSFENVTIYAAPGLGILCQFCENLRFGGVSFIANEEKGRKVVSGRDDGLHLCCNRGKIVIERCYFNGLMDDPINIHGIYARVESIPDSRTLRCRFAHHQAIGFALFVRPGDVFSFVDHRQMRRIGSGEAVSYELDGLEEFTIVFKDSVPAKLEPGDALENLTNTPAAVIRNNFIGSCRARGILISTPKPSVIEDNQFESAGSAILIAGDANQWFESGACGDITIRNNTFMSECLTSNYQYCEAIISIYPTIPEPDPAAPYHGNIVIENNKFNPFRPDCPVLFAFSVQNLEFIHNTICGHRSFKNFYPDPEPVTLRHCGQARIERNTLLGSVATSPYFMV